MFILYTVQLQRWARAITALFVQAIRTIALFLEQKNYNDDLPQPSPPSDPSPRLSNRCGCDTRVYRDGAGGSSYMRANL